MSRLPVAPSSYVVWESQRVPNACRLTDFSVENTFPLRNGEPLAATFPQDVTFAMHPDDPWGTLLVDNLRNIEMLIVASERLTAFLQAREVHDVEFLPVRILDHKQRAIPERYFIVHPVRPIDCLNLAASHPTYSPILPQNINKVERLVIDETRVPAERVLFRCRGFYRAILVHRQLAAAIDQQAFTGIRWVEVEDFGE